MQKARANEMKNRKGNRKVNFRKRKELISNNLAADEKQENKMHTGNTQQICSDTGTNILFSKVFQVANQVFEL